MPKFEIRRAPKDESQYQFRLISSEGEVLLTSEYYVNMDGCLNGIESVKANSVDDTKYSTDFQDGVYFFFLMATNDQSVGKSETFKTEQQMKAAMNAVKGTPRMPESSIPRKDRQTITIDGDNFSDIEGFYDQAYAVLTRGLDWPVAHNLDALNDILYGGFGVYGPDERIILRWTNFEKSRRDLGRGLSIEYYERRAASLTGKRAAHFRGMADELRAGRGESLIDTIVSIIRDKERIELICD